jgi:hypothetical protein
MVGASTLESTRLLLNSRSRLFPNGLANSSGVLGHYLFDQFYVKNCIQCIVPEARGKGPAPRNLMGGGGYIPRFRNLKPGEKKFLRGYAFDFSSGGTPAAKCFPLYGAALSKALDEASNTGFSLTTMGEVLPCFENHACIDPNLKDEWGIASLHISHKYTDNEHLMARCHRHGRRSMPGRRVRSAEGSANGAAQGEHPRIKPAGYADPKTSVLNGFNQSHDVKNLLCWTAVLLGRLAEPHATILALSVAPPSIWR